GARSGAAARARARPACRPASRRRRSASAVASSAEHPEGHRRLLLGERRGLEADLGLALGELGDEAAPRTGLRRSPGQLAGPRERPGLRAQRARARDETGELELGPEDRARARETRNERLARLRERAPRGDLRR